MTNAVIISENLQSVISTNDPIKLVTYSKSNIAGGSSWGSITGILSSQTDLQAELDLKLDSGNLTTNANGLLEIDQGNQTNKYALHIHNMGDGTTGIRIDHRRWGYADLAQASIVNGNYKLTDGFTNTYGKLWSTAGTGDTQGLYVFKNAGAGVDSPVLVAKGMLAQTANLFEAQQDDGTIVSSVDASGNLTTPKVMFNTGSQVYGSLNILNLVGNAINFRSSSDITQFTIQGDSQSRELYNQLPTFKINSNITDVSGYTAGLIVNNRNTTTKYIQEWQAAGTKKAHIDGDGNLGIENASPKVTLADTGGKSYEFGVGTYQNNSFLLREVSANKQLLFINSSGNFGFNTVTMPAQYNFQAFWDLNHIMEIKQIASQTQDFLRCTNNGGAVLASIDASGQVITDALKSSSGNITQTANSIYYRNYSASSLFLTLTSNSNGVYFDSGGSRPLFHRSDITDLSVYDSGFIVNNSNATTKHIQEWQSAGVQKAYIDVNGGLHIGSTASIEAKITGLQLNANNNPSYTLLENKFYLASDMEVLWSTTTNSYNTTDLGLKRDSAGVLKVTDGITGTGDLIVNSLELGNNISLSSPSNAVFDIVAFSNALARFNGYSELRLKDSIKVAWGSTHADTGVADVDIGRDSAGVLKVGDGIGGAGKLLFHKPSINISALHTVVATNHMINCTANNFTVTLPTAVGIQGKEYIIKNSGSGVITVDGDGTETIDGDLTQSLNQYDSLTIVSDNTNWIII
jgi:hypothetical protein